MAAISRPTGRILAALLTALLLPVTGSGQAVTGEAVTLESVFDHTLVSSAGREFQVRISLPWSYELSERRYEAVYVSERGDGFLSLLSAYRALHRDGAVPDLLLVGFDPASLTADSGAFAEVVGVVESNLRTTGRRTLVGSAGAGGWALEQFVAGPVDLWRLLVSTAEEEDLTISAEASAGVGGRRIHLATGSPAVRDRLVGRIETLVGPGTTVTSSVYPDRGPHEVAARAAGEGFAELFAPMGRVAVAGGMVGHYVGPGGLKFELAVGEGRLLVRTGDVVVFLLVPDGDSTLSVRSAMLRRALEEGEITVNEVGPLLAVESVTPPTEGAVSSVAVTLAGEGVVAERLAGTGADYIGITTSSLAARDAYLTGRRLLEAGLVTEARPHIERALELDPDFALAHLAAARLGAQEEARGHLEAAVRTAGSTTPGERLLVEAATAGGDIERRRAAVEQLVMDFPEDPRAWLERGRFELRTANDPEAAVEAIERALSLDERLPARILLAEGLVRLGRNEEARSALARHVEEHGESGRVLTELGHVELALGDLPAAFGHFVEALGVDPGYPPAAVGMSWVRNLRDEHGQALRVLQSLQRGDGGPALERTARYQMAVSRADAGELEGAREELGELESLADTPARRAEVALALGSLSLAESDAAGAAAHFSRARELLAGSELPELLLDASDGLVRARLLAGDIGGARTLVEAGPVRSSTRAAVLLEEGATSEAIALLRALPGPGARDLHLLGTAYEAAGRVTEAIEAYRRAANFNRFSEGGILEYALLRREAAARAEALSGG